MTKLSFINNNPDDKRLTIRKLSKESTIAPLAEVLNSYTLCPDRVGFCLGPYVKPIESPTIAIKDTSLFEGFVTDRLDIELVSNHSTLPAGWTIEPVFKVAGEQPITDQFNYDAKSPFLLQGIELIKAATNTTFSVAFKLLNKGKLVMTTEYKSFTIATGRARIQYTAPMKIVEGQEIITVTGSITLGKRGNPVKFTFTDTTDPTSNKKVEYDAVVNSAGQFSFKIDLSSFLDGNIFIATTGVGIDNAVITGPYQTIDNFFPLVVKVLGGRNLRVSTAANGVLNIPNRVTWGDNRAGPLATGHMVHTYATATTAVHELQIRRNTGPLVVVELAECTLDSNYTKVETSAITEIVNFGKAVLGVKLFKAITLTKVPDFLPSHMTNLDDMFNGAKTFNSPSLVKWNLKNVVTAQRMLKDTIFNQNLSKSCVSNLRTEPTEFSTGAPLTSANKPVWGTCPLLDDTSQVTLRNSAGYGVELSKASISNDYSRDNPAIYDSKYISLTCYKPLLLIGDRAFKDQLISELSFIPNLKQIGNEAFMNNQLETVTIYGGITQIGDRAFAGNPLRFVGVIENTPPVLGVDAPASVKGIYVPDSAVAKYKSANGWGNYAGVIKPLSTAPGVIYTVMYDESKPETKYTLYFIDTVVPGGFLKNNRVTINSISEGVVKLEDDALFGTQADELVIPASLKTVDGGIRIRSKILRFADGFDFEVMRDKLIDLSSESTLILPPSVTDLNWFLSPNQIGTIVCPSQTPPLLYNQPYNTWKGVTTIYTSFGLVASNKKPTRAIYVPADSIDAYRADLVWSKLTDNFLPIEEFEYGLVTGAKIADTAADGSWTEVIATARVEDAGKTGNVILLTGVLVNGYYEWFERARTDAVVDSQGKFLGRVTIPTQYKDDARAWMVSVEGGNRFQVVN